MRARRRHRTRGQSGQALVETTMVLLILLFSLTGMFAVGSEANDKNIATSAVRAGGRFVAQLGAYQWAVGQPTNPNVVDGPAVREVCDIARTMSNMTVTSITIYRPSVVGGAQQPGDPADEYDFPANVNPSTCQVNGSPPTPTLTNFPPASACVGAPTQGYQLNCRRQVHPYEALVGVRLQYQYRSNTPLIQVNANGDVYTVTPVAPVFT